jgi:hypothetical protein
MTLGQSRDPRRQLPGFPNGEMMTLEHDIAGEMASVALCLLALQEQIAKSEKQAAELKQHLDQLARCREEWMRITALIKHDIEAGADPEVLIECLVKPFLAKETEPGHREIIVNYLETLRSEGRAQQFSTE